MKLVQPTVLRLALFSLLILALSACTLTIDLFDGFDVTGFTYSTSFPEGSSPDIICDDLTTTLTYSFTVSGGQPSSWTSQLKGENTGQIKGKQTFIPGDPQVTRSGNTYSVTYVIAPRQAPLLIDGDLATQGIDVTPTGSTILELAVIAPNGEVFTLSESAKPVIPVVNKCTLENFELSSFSYSTDWVDSNPANGQSEYVICNNRTTNLTYRFKYSGGQPTDWTSQLRGKTTGQINGVVNLSPGLPQVAQPSANEYLVNYEIRAGAAPKLEGIDTASIEAQAINVTPNGATYLDLTVRGNGFAQTLANPPEIPVVDNCP